MNLAAVAQKMKTRGNDLAQIVIRLQEHVYRTYFGIGTGALLLAKSTRMEQPDSKEGSLGNQSEPIRSREAQAIVLTPDRLDLIS
jgi:hypothetical protein